MVGQPETCRQESTEAAVPLAFSTHLFPPWSCQGKGGSTAGAHGARTRVRPGQVKLGPKQVSLPSSWQDVHPPEANTALLLLLSSLHSVWGSGEAAPTTACPGDKSSSTDGSNTWKDRVHKNPSKTSSASYVFAFFNSESLSAHLL